MTYALIDIGSNTVKMTRYAADATLLKKYTDPTALLAYIDDRRLTKEGLTRLIAVLHRYITIAAKEQDEIHAFATASFRAFDNAEEVRLIVKDTLGLSIDVISGEREAALSLVGIGKASGIDPSGHTVFDLGGGSLEIAICQNDHLLTHSFKTGALAMHLGFVKNILPTEDEMKAIYQAAQAAYQELPEKKGEAFAVGGSLRALCHLLTVERSEHYDEALPYCVSRQEATDFLSRIARQEKGLMLRMIDTEPKRIHTVPSGLVAFLALTDTMGFDHFTVVAGGVREGYLEMILKKEENA